MGRDKGRAKGGDRVTNPRHIGWCVGTVVTDETNGLVLVSWDDGRSDWYEPEQLQVEVSQ